MVRYEKVDQSIFKAAHNGKLVALSIDAAIDDIIVLVGPRQYGVVVKVVAVDNDLVAVKRVR